MSLGAANSECDETKPHERAKGESFDAFTRDGESANPFGGGFNGQVDVNGGHVARAPKPISRSAGRRFRPSSPS